MKLQLLLHSDIMVDKPEQSWATVHKEYCQNGGQKNLPEKKNPSRETNSAGNLGGIHDSCSEKPTLRRLHDEGYCPLFHDY